MNWKNTKLYTQDLELVRKYCDIVGKRIPAFLQEDLDRFSGVCNGVSGKIRPFGEGSFVDMNDGSYPVVTEEQVEEAYNKRFVVDTLLSAKDLQSFPEVYKDSEVSYTKNRKP